MLKFCGVPSHPLATGVTVMFAVIGSLLVFVPEKEEILPVPLAASPIEGLSLVHL